MLSCKHSDCYHLKTNKKHAANGSDCCRKFTAETTIVGNFRHVTDSNNKFGRRANLPP